MRTKVTNFALDLECHAVTCPGVWLCPDGNVSVRVRLFSEVAETKHLPPVFPILYHEKFTFQKLFPGIYFLTELQEALQNEMLFAELVQWPRSGSEIVLATFQTTLLDFLYPSTGRKTTDVDMLMDPTDAFPGILTPKVEMSTRTTVEEIPVTESELHNVSASILLNSLKHDLDRSVQHSIREPLKRQRKVCHSLGVHDKKGNCSFTLSQSRYNKSGSQSPFSIRNLDNTVNTYESFLNTPKKRGRKKDVLNSTPFVHWTSVSDSSSCGDESPMLLNSTFKNHRKSTKIGPLGSLFSSGETSARKNIIIVNSDIMNKKTEPDSNVSVIDGESHNTDSCMLCSEYKSFFEDKKSNSKE